MDAQAISDAMKAVGLNINASKSHLMIIELGKPKPLLPPLTIDGVAVPEVKTLRYLGTLLDKRMSLEPHWLQVSASCKALMGSLSRMVGDERGILRAFYTERVEAKIRFSLGPCPPCTVRAWDRLTAAVSYCAKQITNRWDRHGVGGIREAGLTPPTELAATMALKFLYASRFEGRRWGRWVERMAELPTRYPGTRRKEALTGEELLPPSSHSTLLEKLQPRRMVLLYNSFLAVVGKDKIVDVLKSAANFAKAIPAFLALLSSDERRWAATADLYRLRMT
jgi:hypothetical protein